MKKVKGKKVSPVHTSVYTVPRVYIELLTNKQKVANEKIGKRCE